MVEGDALWASLPVPALVLDGEGRVEDINPAAELFLNTSAKSIKKAPIWDQVFVDAELEQGLARIRGSEAALFLNDVHVGSGERAPELCNMQIAPMADQGGQVLVLIEPRRIAESMGRGMSHSAAARSAIGMAEMLAHEIKNPLAGITGAAQLLSMGLSPEDQELTDLIVAETRRVIALLGQVEEFGNVVPPDRKPVNVHDVLDQVRRSAAIGFAAHMTFEEFYDPSLPPTLGDAGQLGQVFSNLLRNAAEAAPRGGTIRIRTYYELRLRLHKSADGDGAVPLQIEIIDDGPGLPKEIADNIFEPFVSGRSNGTGLGLALVSKIVDDHDGWIAVESVPGRTVFRVSLPVAKHVVEDL